MQTIRSSLIGISLCVLTLGFLSGTLVREVIHLAPIVAALRLLSRSPGYLGAYAAVSISVFWMLYMALSWLSALGVWDLIRGDASPAELALTVLTALFAWVGFSRGRRAGRSLERHHKVATLAVFGVLQIVAVTLGVIGPTLAD